MIMVKYNGTQKNYNDTDFFCIYMYCTHIYTSLLIRTGTSYRTNTEFISQMVFHMYMCHFIL